MKKFLYIIFVLLSVFSVVFAQTKPRKTVTKKNTKPTEQTTKQTEQTTNQTVPTPTPINESEQVKTPIKKNERPTNGNSSNSQTKAVNNLVYFYEFSQPEFIVSKISIEHDENGRGEISFLKKGWDTPDSDPIQLSPATLGKIKNALNTLNFLDSTENYQYEKDYSHLGNIIFTVRKDGRERTIKFNWTTNPEAKILMDEYRRISNQYLWIFDINVARENQPLDAPRQMDALDAYIRRDEISDPAQMIPFLTDLSNDERIPLIARNHATRIIKEIEKEIEKKKEDKK